MSDEEGDDDDYEEIDESEIPDSEEEDDEEAEEAAEINELLNKDGGSKNNTILGKVLIVNPIDRVTSNILQQNEMASVLGKRTIQIDSTGIHFVGETKLTNAADIAKLELIMRKCPLKITRIVGVAADGSQIAEIWSVNEMVINKDMMISYSSKSV